MSPGDVILFKLICLFVTNNIIHIILITYYERAPVYDSHAFICDQHIGI